MRGSPMNDEDSLKVGKMDDVETGNKKNEPKLSVNFQKLTPEKGLGEKGLIGYKEALNYAFTDEDISNVALTGVYGSGKSSILESYKKDSDLKFLHISLSYFDKRENEIGLESEGNKSLDSDSREKDLEGKILNQLLHQIDSREIPQTIFRTKKKVKKLSIFFISTLFLLSVASILYLLDIVPWVNYLKVFFLDMYRLQSFFPVPSKNTLDKFAIIIVLLSTLYLIYKLIITQLNRKIFKGFSFKSSGVESDIEIFAEAEASYFDKFLDDVLYLFVQSKADVIVFEDIDRFEDEGIFEKLKEINTLVNNKLMSDKEGIGSKIFSKKKHKLRFMYLLKDDLFLSKDRTKFFDFIIPVVPVVTSTNSYEKLKELLDSSSMYEKFDRNFLQKISLYIDDMRLMKNIYNEFLIYSKRIDILKLSLSNNELLALLTYKNIFPKDFSELLFNGGFVYDLFKDKENYISTREEEIREDISILQTRINDADNELVSSIDELMSLYIPYTIRFGGNKHKGQFSSGGDFISAMRETQEVIHYLYQSNNWTTITFEEIEEKIEENPDFIKRKEMLIDRRIKEKIQNEIVNLKMDLNLIKNSKIRDIVSREQIIELAKERYPLIEKNGYFELIVFLIHNGYINEGYSDYITYFYDNSLRINDKNFLRSITDEKALDWNFSLTEQLNVKEEVLDRMDISDFSKIESLNFDLFEYMVLTQSNPLVVNYLDAYFRMIKNSKKIQFLVESFLYYSSQETQEKSILSILKYDSSLFTDIFSSNHFSDEQLSEFSVALLLFLDSGQFKSSNLAKNPLIREFISNSANFFSKAVDVNRDFIENIKAISPCFKSVNFSEIDKKLAEVILNNNMYEINFVNLSSALGHFFNITDEGEIRHKNYSTIRNVGDSPILAYIESVDEVDNYVSQYVSFSNGKIEDDLESIYKLINNKNLALTESKKYISCLETNDMELDKVKYDEDYPTIIKHRKARANEMNIIIYFVSQGNEWTDDLVEFINDESAEYSFDKEKAKKYIDSEESKKFFSKTAKNNSIPNEKYRDIMIKIDKDFTSFIYENLSDEKIEILIELDKIVLTETSLQTFRYSYPDFLIEFILKNSLDYIEYIQDINFTEEVNSVYYEELYAVLERSQSLPIEQQKELIDCFEEDEVISINNDYYSNDLKAYVLSTRFNIEDLAYICETYDNQSEIMKVEIYKRVKTNQLLIIDQNIALSKKLLDLLLIDGDVELEKKQLLMSRNIENIDLNNLAKVFIDLKLPTFVKLFDKKEPTFEINETNENILSYLDKREVISSFREYKGKLKAFNRSRRKQHFDFLD